MKKIGVIINPHAKIIRKKKKHLELYKKLHGDHVDINITETLDDIVRVMNRFKEENISYLAIVGGDGSIHNVITKALNVYSPGNVPDIVILKGGTMNNIARSLGLKGKGPEILKRLVNKIKEGKEIRILERDTMKIQGCYCFIFVDTVVVVANATVVVQPYIARLFIYDILPGGYY